MEIRVVFLISPLLLWLVFFVENHFTPVETEEEWANENERSLGIAGVAFWRGGNLRLPIAN